VIRARSGNLVDSAMVTVKVRYQDVVPGQTHTCAVSKTAVGVCWGLSRRGAVGVGVADPNSTSPILIPMAVSDTLRFRAISAGTGRDVHSCAVTREGDPYCWGSNFSGQIGNGRFGENAFEGRPVLVGSAVRFVSIAAGEEYTCGVDRSGAGFCWGNNAGSALGSRFPVSACHDHEGTPYSCSIYPARLETPPLASISTGRHACALDTAGQAYCWGPNSRGQVGNGPGGSDTEPLPVPVQQTTTFAEIQAGDFHTCALDTAGEAYCWGSNADGQLGIGSADDGMHPTPGPVAGDFRFRVITAGGGYSCGIAASGDAYCWGRNTDGQLGDGSTTDRPLPTRVLGGLRFSTVRAGISHTCGVAESGVAYCWGLGTDGQLGTGLTASSSVPLPIQGQ
jgi:alpha-tubulin suppressor-like RCC1 family protein